MTSHIFNLFFSPTLKLLTCLEKIFESFLKGMTSFMDNPHYVICAAIQQSISSLFNKAFFHLKIYHVLSGPKSMILLYGNIWMNKATVVKNLNYPELLYCELQMRKTLMLLSNLYFCPCPSHITFELDSPSISWKSPNMR